MKLLLVVFVLLHYSCGIEVYDRVIYPQGQNLTETGSKQECPLLESGYSYLVSDLIQKSCMASCHESGGIGENTLNFSGSDKEGGRILMDYLNKNFNKFLDKATARIDHIGGAALKREEEENFKKFFLLSEICE